MKYLIAAIILVSGIVACAVAPKTPAQSIYAIETNYAAALTAAVAYKRLPTCAYGATTSKVCSDPYVVARLQKADDAAIALLDGAQITVRSGKSGSQLAIRAAEQAVAALTSITATLGE